MVSNQCSDADYFFRSTRVKIIVVIIWTKVSREPINAWVKVTWQQFGCCIQFVSQSDVFLHWRCRTDVSRKDYPGLFWLVFTSVLQYNTSPLGFSPCLYFMFHCYRLLGIEDYVEILNNCFLLSHFTLYRFTIYIYTLYYLYIFILFTIYNLLYYYILYIIYYIYILSILPLFAGYIDWRHPQIQIYESVSSI